MQPVEDEREEARTAEDQRRLEHHGPVAEAHGRHHEGIGRGESSGQISGVPGRVRQELTQFRTVPCGGDVPHEPDADQRHQDLQQEGCDGPTPQGLWAGVAEQEQQRPEQRVEHQDVAAEQERGVEQPQRQQAGHAAQVTARESRSLGRGGPQLLPDSGAEHHGEQRVGLHDEQRGDRPPQRTVRRRPPCRRQHTAGREMRKEIDVHHRDAEQRTCADEVGEGSSDTAHRTNLRPAPCEVTCSTLRPAPLLGVDAA